MDLEAVAQPRIPVSTYRLNFNQLFTFSDATKILSYLDELGITDIYASPYLKAQKGSIVGYDVVDPTRINPEIGSTKEYERFTGGLAKRDMGQILDIVPNHMYIDSEDNVWWFDVLENGPSSPYASFFDIDWKPVKRELENKILIPILGEQYGRILENQELKLTFKRGSFFLNYYNHRLPILPETYIHILKHGIDRLETLLAADDASLIEFQSIMTALTCLPSYTEREQGKLVERRREKEIIKNRLHKLYKESHTIRDFIGEKIRVFNGNKEEPHSFDLLDSLLDKQVWRLSYWRVATEEINYRRFFDINSLAAIRMEDPIVFRKTHQLILKLIRENKVTGLRVDHPDGLYNPAEYMKRLQREAFLQVRLSKAQKDRETSASTQEADLESEILKEYAEITVTEPQFKPFYIVGEKILSKDEKLPEDWPIFSGIGYTFLNPVHGIFVDNANAKAFDRIYDRFVGSHTDYQDLVYEKKRLIMLASMSGEINMLAHHLSRISEKNRHTRDLTLNSLRTAIMEVIACFPVYRTYISHAGVSQTDRRYVDQAVAKAKRKNPSISGSIFDYLRSILLVEYRDASGESERVEWVDFAMRFQQVTGPVMAKGVEDTAFYVYERLLSLNEVGGNPESFGTPVDSFHAQNAETAVSRPHSLITTATHDMKRGEDTRVRLDVLSELPVEWQRCLSKWSRANRKHKPVVEGRMVPDRNEEYFVYQTLLGVWPCSSMTADVYEEFVARIRDYVLKAIREAKVNTSWTNPDTSYEEAFLRFIDSIMSKSTSNTFMEDFLAFQKRVSYFGMFNSLSQALLKITSPGVPDFYQGTELWDLSLVDPDNRRPVNFSMRARMLQKLKKRIAECGDKRIDLASELMREWKDGSIKLYVTFAALNYRKENRVLFRKGGYVPLTAEGTFKENFCGYGRVTEERTALILVPRFLTRLLKDSNRIQIGAREWKDTGIIVPGEIPRGTYRNIFTNEVFIETEQNGIRKLLLRDIFAEFPVALLDRQTNP